MSDAASPPAAGGRSVYPQARWPGQAGYRSEAACSGIFKRHFGIEPGAYYRRMKSG